MPTLRSILTDTPSGLLTRLEAEFGGNWQRFQVHPWDFKVTDLTNPDKPVLGRGSGVRLRACNSQSTNYKGVVATQNIVLGYILETTTNNMEAQLLASEFQNAVDRLINDWSQNCAPLEREIEEIGGSIVVATRPGEGGVWSCAVTREFDIVYQAG